MKKTEKDVEKYRINAPQRRKEGIITGIKENEEKKKCTEN